MSVHCTLHLESGSFYIFFIQISGNIPGNKWKSVEKEKRYNHNSPQTLKLDYNSLKNKMYAIVLQTLQSTNYDTLPLLLRSMFGFVQTALHFVDRSKGK